MIYNYTFRILCGPIVTGWRATFGRGPRFGHKWSDTNARKRIVDSLALKYYGHILKYIDLYSKKSFSQCGYKHRCDPTHYNLVCNIFKAPMKSADW